MLSFAEKLENYARLAVENGVNVQKGQTLVIIAPISKAEFVRNLVEKAYRAGAKHVYVDWADDHLTLTKFKMAPEEAFKDYPKWKARGREELAKNGAAFLYLDCPNPDLLKDVDPRRMATYNKTARKALETFAEYQMADRVSWSIIAVPTKEWAKKVFPNEPEEAAVRKLWEHIFTMTRADTENPVEAWQRHKETLTAKAAYLNDKQYKKFHYRAPGTDLTIEFPDNHVWAGASGTNDEGDDFLPNIPTEEVFTLPYKYGVNGTVASTKPLNYNGQVIEQLSVTFENGKIIDFTAEKGYETFKKLIETDEGSRYLGEVALVPHQSPISQAGLIFFNTLFDENASCHLAVGKAYPASLKGGTSMSRKELEEKGVNHSLTHVDFMIGCENLDIDGITSSGETEPIFRNGNWAF
ncbi:MAG TPA: aminopeptidase [Bacillales bacterium]|nr:aminopeptidase [Bacillales bacterium]